MPEFSHRSTNPEVMDDLQIGGEDLDRALSELDAINYALGGNYVTLNGLSQMVEQTRRLEYHIADLGCGSGDMLRRIRRLLDKRNIAAKLTGIDANENVIAFANAHTPRSCRIEYEAMNIFSTEFQSQKFDIVTATLFFHHFSDQNLVYFFKKLREQVSLGMVINDIHRHWFAFYSITWLTRIFSRSAMVKHDAPASVARAFRRKELEDILRRAGISRFRIRWCWAFRWQIIVWF